jgi:hypothetical protein
MWKLTTILLRWSTGVIEGRNRLTVMDSGKVLWKGTMKSSRSRTLLDMMLPPEDLDVEAELSRYSTDSGVVDNGG